MKVAIAVLLLVVGAAASDRMLEIESTSVTAGDLSGVAPGFDDLDPAFPFSRAPAPGVTRRVSRYELARWAASAGLDYSLDDGLEALPDALLIRRKMRLIGEQEARAAIREAAARAQDARLEDVEVELHGYAPRAVPATAAGFEATSLPRELNEPGLARLRWLDPGGRSGVETVRATLRVRGEWLVARADVAAGARLSGADVRRETGFLPAPRKDLLQPDLLEQEPQLTRGLRAQETVLHDDVRFTPLVERGALVELRLQLGGVRLRTPARAEQSGARGELIACRNLETGRRVLGRVVDARSVVLEANGALRSNGALQANRAREAKHVR